MPEVIPKRLTFNLNKIRILYSTNHIVVLFSTESIGFICLTTSSQSENLSFVENKTCLSKTCLSGLSFSLLRMAEDLGGMCARGWAGQGMSGQEKARE